MSDDRIIIHKSIKLVFLIATGDELHENGALIRLTSASEPQDGFEQDPFGQSNGQNNLFCPVDMKTGLAFISAIIDSNF